MAVPKTVTNFLFGSSNKERILYFILIIIFIFIFVFASEVLLPSLWWSGRGEIAIFIGILIAIIGGLRDYGFLNIFVLVTLYGIGVYRTSAYTGSSTLSEGGQVLFVIPRVVLIVGISSIMISFPSYLLAYKLKDVFDN